MNRTIRILTLLAVMAITAGQAWADEPTYGKIHYTNGSTDGGTLTFYKDADCSAAITIDGTTHKSDVLNSTDLTDATVYIKAMPDFGFSGINVEFTAEESIGSGAAEAPRRHAPGVGQNVTVTAVEGKPGIYQFTMPSNGNNVTISATFPEKAYLTGVNYMDLSAENPQKTTAEGAKVWILDGTEWTVGKDNTETWCVCNSNLDYNHILNIKGDIHLILADGAEMSVTSTDTNYGYAVGTNSSSIAIYGQTLGTGMLSAIGKDHGIFASNGNVTINHCKVTATGSSYGIYANPWNSNCGVTINGSEVSATSTLGNGIHAGYITISNSKVTANGKSDGFFAAAQSVSITGGEVNVTGSSEGIYAKSNITINNCETKVQGNYGLHTGGGNISVTGGELTATGIGSESYAVQASGSGTITLSNCTANVTGSYGIYTSYRSVSITGGELTATCKLGISGNVTLDGAKVTLDCTEGTTGIQGNSCSITNNAIVNVTAKEEGIVIWGPFTMDSGQLTTTATSTGTNVHGLRANTVTITGGQVTATGATYGILATSGDITLGWTNATDFIKASSFKPGSSNAVKTADGKPMIAYIPASDNTPEKQAVLIQGKEGGMTLTTNAVAAIAGKVLRPATADDVTVSYMDWDDTQKKLVSKNTATDNVADNDIVYVLQGGGATDLPGGWYVARGEVSYNGKLKLTGDAHFILADDAEMSITPSTGHGIQSGGDIAIYSQSVDTKMGQLTITTTGGYNAIYTNDDADGDVSITINGGNINTTTNGISQVIYSAANNGTANVTINGGKVNTVNHTDKNGRGISAASFNSVADVTIRGGEVSISTYTDGICTRSNNGTANITISGGQVSCITEAEPGIKASTDFGTANINLSLTNGTDFIKATSYYAALESTGISASVKIPTGKALIIDGTTTVLGSTDADYIFGDGTSATLASIAGKTLRPSKNVPVATGEQYTALYQELGDWKVTNPSVKMYVPTNNIFYNENTKAYEMELQEVTGGGIPNSEPIIIGTESGALPTNIPVVGTSTAEASNIESAYNATEAQIKQKQEESGTEPTIIFFATNTTETIEDQIAKAVNKGKPGSVDATDFMVLTLEKGTLKPVIVNHLKAPNVKKPTFLISKLNALKMIRGTFQGKKANNNAPTFGIPLDFGDEATDIEGVKEVKDNTWYTLDGRKLEKAPTKKGIYINGGRKVVVK